MRAMLTRGRALSWEEVPDPVPAAGEVLIEVQAAGVNRADLLQRAGGYPPPPGWPEWLGLEAAGIVRQAPPGSRWRAGDRVCALLGGGGYAELAAVPQELVLPVPAGLGPAEAAAIPEAFATAFLNLHLEAGMQAGDTVLVHAGASGVGMAAIQLAKAAGATVVATVGSPAKAAFAAGLGADVVVDRRSGDLDAALARHPPDIALDCVAGPALGRHLAAMRRGGRWIVIAALGGKEAGIDLGDLLRRGVRLIGSTLRSRSPAAKADLLARMERQLWPAFAAGALRVALHRVLPMAAAEEAHAILRGNANLGKVVLALPAGAGAA